MKYILFNGLSNSNKGEESANEAFEKFGEGTEKVDIVGLDVKEWISGLTEQDTVILCGGDGTINRFANDCYSEKLPCPILLYKAGTGNDFLRDISENYEKEEVPEINKYIENLPTVKVKDIDCHYINGIGFGIDGKCCEVADRMKEEGKTDINYAGIAIKLLLFKYKCPTATITIDGEEKIFKKVWFASAMNGRYYGGGMKAAPEQDRLSDKLSAVVWYGGGKIGTLMNFPNIFKGTHIKSKHVYVTTAKEITVKFDSPMALQIDGETVLDVTEYTARK